MCGHVASLTLPVEAALGKIRHRGIRSKISYGAHAASSMGHVRLPIVGLGAEYDQPRGIGPWLLSFVGEVVNFKEIDHSLECDTQLVERTWYSEGAEGFCKFDGFWSVMAIDNRDCSLHLLCDYLAQKPLYFREDTASAASELEAMEELGPVTPDKIYFASVIKWGYCPETWRTPYNEVRRVKPGHHVILRAGLEAEIRYVDKLRPAPGFGDMKALIDVATWRRVRSSDVPVTALVSGGLDSAIVWHLANQYRGLSPVTPIYCDDGNDEAVRRVLGDQSPVRVAWDKMSPQQALLYMQEPVDLGSLVPQAALSDAVGAIGVNVCLTGDGADELFGGYGRSMRYDSQASDVFHELVGWHLPRLDRVMMRNRVEVRSPFLARDVVQAALAIPWDWRRNKGYLRHLYKDDLPPGVSEHKKMPLRTPKVEQDREKNSIMLVEMFCGRRGWSW